MFVLLNGKNVYRKKAVRKTDSSALLLPNQKFITSYLGIENGLKKGSISLFVLVIPGKYRGRGCHLFLPQFTNSSFTKYDSPPQQYTEPFITSELKYTQYCTLQ
jgi:hypothetical protein